MMKFSKISFIFLLSLGLSAISLAAGNIIEAVNDTEREIIVYPNPVVGDEFTIKADKEIVEVTVLNVLGQQVYTQKFVHVSKVRIDIETDDSGLYLVQVKTIDGMVTTKRILFK